MSEDSKTNCITTMIYDYYVFPISNPWYYIFKISMKNNIPAVGKIVISLIVFYLIHSIQLNCFQT